MIPLLYILFVLSGAAGLFYESVWGRYLSLFVGHGAYAQVIVLVIFLGGMALGAALVSRRSERLADPLRAYGWVEVAVGVVGLAFHGLAYQPVTGWAYDSLFPALGGGTAVLAAKWAIAGLLILPQSILLGTTFPLMSAGVLRRSPAAPGTVLSFLYFSNSLGAAAGVLIAGFVLAASAGLPGTLQAAAILNLGVGAAALVASRLRPGGPAPEADAPPRGAAAPTDAGLVPLRSLTVLLVLAAAGTAMASFVYEIAWIRLLSLVLGSATHSFELMLSAFILGLALGAWWIRRRAERITRPLAALAVIQLVMGTLAIASLVVTQYAFTWMGMLMAAVARTDQGYVLFTVARYAICLAIMLPATFCAGMTLPLITRTLLVHGGGEAAIGRVYAWNTAGSIVGAVLAGLVLVPVLGLKATVVVGGLGDVLVGVGFAATLARHGAPARRLALKGLALAVLLPVLAAVTVRLDRALLTSGVFRTGRLARAEGDVLFYRDGRTSTVAVTRAPSNRLIISTNGKPDGSLHRTWLTECAPGDTLRVMSGDDPTQILLAAMTLAHRPAAERAAIIGHGTGMSTHTLLASPALRSVVTVEIEPAMVEGSRLFHPANRRAFEDPRSSFVVDDAKSYFAAANRTFDLIMAEPSNPWVSGVSGLFTTEFYGRLRRHVAPGGILGQWLHTYELSDYLVASVLAAIHGNFADYRIYAVNGGDLLILASPEGRVPAPDWSVFELPSLRADLCHFYPIRTEHLEATLLTTRQALAPLLDRIRQPNSDFFPVLDLGAERARFLGQNAEGVMSLFGGLYDFVGPPGPAAPVLPDTATVSALLPIPRVWALVSGSSLRRGGPSAEGDTAWGFSARGDIDDRVRNWLRSVRAEEPPATWQTWTRAFWNGFGLWHAGTRGWVDTTFMGPVTRYLDRLDAPPPVRAVVTLRERVASLDYAAADAPLRVLVQEARARRRWVDPAMLREAGLLVYGTRGRTQQALALDQALAGLARRDQTDFRTQLLEAWVRAAARPGRRN